tara:strand:+ start:1621 stop:1842 length:222 start_codon:yes stop_codon:yes gene_type:complete
MEKSKLSDAFSMCTLLMHDAVTDFYENLHDEKGKPITVVEDVTRKSDELKRRFLNELQMVVDITLEFNDTHGK